MVGAKTNMVCQVSGNNGLIFLAKDQFHMKQLKYNSSLLFKCVITDKVLIYGTWTLYMRDWQT